MRFKKTQVGTFRSILAVGLSLLAFISTMGAGDQLANKRYVDPKGFFRIVPPAGWRVQEYPQDPRGKVAFIGPAANTDLRVLVNAVDFSTIDELVEFCRSVESRIGISTNIQKIVFDGRPAVKRSSELQGIKFLMIDFLVGSVDHNLQFGAPSSVYQKYFSVVTKSMETYEPILRDISDRDIIKHQLAKKIRLAQLMIDIGNYEMALEYIKEGLELSPQNAELLKLKKEVENKIGK